MPASTSIMRVCVCRLALLQQSEDEKMANQLAKNLLESHIFETKDAMYSEVVVSMSTEEQREVVLTSLNEVGDWLEDDGYVSETKVGWVINGK